MLIAVMAANDLDLMQVKRIALMAACGWDVMRNAGNE